MLIYIQSSTCIVGDTDSTNSFSVTAARGIKNILKSSLYIIVFTFLINKNPLTTVQCVDTAWNRPIEPVVAGFFKAVHTGLTPLCSRDVVTMSHVLWRQRGDPREGKSFIREPQQYVGVLEGGRTNSSSNFGVSTLILERPPRMLNKARHRQ